MSDWDYTADLDAVGGEGGGGGEVGLQHLRKKKRE